MAERQPRGKLTPLKAVLGIIIVFIGAGIGGKVGEIVGGALFALLFGGGLAQGDIEKSIRDEMKAKMGVAITSFDLYKQGDRSYTGTATAQNGDVYDVTTSPPKGAKIEWTAFPSRAMVEKQVRAGLEKQLSAKVKTLQLTKNGPGNYSGPAELETGLKVIVTTRIEGAQVLWEAKPVNP